MPNRSKPVPGVHLQREPLPQIENKDVPTPVIDQTEALVPRLIDEENSIHVGEQIIELKPTKLKYFRNNAVQAYSIIEKYGLAFVFSCTEERNGLDGDKAILEFVAAVLDDVKLAKKIYNDMDGSQMMRMIRIFKRLNEIPEVPGKNGAATKA